LSHVHRRFFDVEDVTIMAAISKAKPAHLEHQHLSVEHRNASAEHKNYKGFVGGIFSGVAKLSSQSATV